MRAANRRGDSQPPPAMISVEALASYAVCHRQWWLLRQEGEGEEPAAYTIAARRIAAQRERLSTRLAMIGGGLIGGALLVLIIGLLLR